MDFTAINPYLIPREDYPAPMLTPEEQKAMYDNLSKVADMKPGPKKKIIPTPEGSLEVKPISSSSMDPQASVPEIVQANLPVTDRQKQEAHWLQREAKIQEALNEQRSGIASLEDKARQIAATPRQIDFSALASYFDSVVPGSKLSQNYKAPETEMERQKQLMALENAIQKEKQGLTASEIEWMTAGLKNSPYNQDTLDDELKKAKIGAYKAAAGVKADTRTENDVQDLQKRIGDGAAGLNFRLQELDKLIPKDRSDVPGTGVGASYAPDFLLSSEGRAIQQHARGIVGDLIKIQSGTAASEGEVNRKMIELGMGPGSTTESFLRGLKNTQAKAKAELKAKEAAFRPEVVEKYKSRGGITSSGVVDVLTDDPELKELEMLRSKKAGK